MLTTEAFNALLKTLEEPPEHVYFMFATTELHKVPVTILSRCQRYELKRVSHTELYDHFASLAAGEGVQIDGAALNMVVREAEGSVRDGLSLLDQVFSYCGDTVTGQKVVEVLGLVSHQVIADLAEALLAGDLATALARLDDIYSYGMDLKRFINELLSWFRGLVVCSVSKQPEQLLDLPADELAVLQKTAAAYSSQSLSFMFHLLMEGLEKAAFASHPRFGVEMVFIKAVQAGDVVPLTDLLGRLDDVLAGVELPQAVEPLARRKSGRVVGALPTKDKKEVAGNDSASSAVEKKTEPVLPKPEIEHDPVPQVEEIPLPPEPVIMEPVVAIQEEQKKSKSAGREKNVRAHWPEFIEYVRDRKKWMAATLQRASSAQLEEGQLIIVYNDSVDCRILKSKENMTQLSEFAMDFFQESMQIKFKVPDSSACDTDPDSGAAVQKERQALANDPIVLTALEVFNGQVGDIRVGPRFRKPLNGESNQGSSD
jgi:DNA polymerase-3 subunit gamma/tau